MVFVLFVVVFLSFLLLWSLSRIWMCVYFHILTSSQYRARAITPSVVSPLTYTHFSTLFSHVMWCRLFWLCFFLYWLDSVGYKIQCIACCCCFVCIYWLILLFLYWFHDVCVCAMVSSIDIFNTFRHWTSLNGNVRIPMADVERRRRRRRQRRHHYCHQNHTLEWHNSKHLHIHTRVEGDFWLIF